ncbi:MAG: ATP synthase subunit I [Gammaproteobacteria bacterium]
MLHSARIQAFLLSGLQGGLILTCALFWLLFQGKHAAYSALLGGLVWWLPNLYFTYKVFQRRGARDAYRIVKTFYWNEIIKLMLFGLLFIISLNFLAVIRMPFISGFMAALLAVWLTPCYMLRYVVSKP